MILEGNTSFNTKKNAEKEKSNEETTNMIKKFHFMILHLQNKLAEKVILIFLKEMN